MSTSTAASSSSVAVLGLGRMGSAIAARLRDRGRQVIAWSRSGRPVPNVETVADASTAVARADVLLLCLFDGAACRDVLDEIRDQLDETTVVVNTSTVGIPEAVAIAAEVRATGARYVHAPVMGSVPAVRAGTLTVLVGADDGDSDAAQSVLAELGDLLDCGTVADAAAAKLLANGVLGSSLLSLRDSRQRADELGIEPGQALTVLERTLLGRLVAGRRIQLEKGDFSDADFAVGAIAKDLWLLAEAAPSAAPLRDAVTAALERGSVAPDDDILALCVVPPADDERRHGLTVDPAVTAPPEVLAPLEAYVAGHATGDSSYHRRAFLPTAHVEGIRDSRFVSWTVDEYCALFTGRGADDEPRRRRRIDRVSVEGTIGTASMTLWHGADVFTDMFLLLRVGGEWRIANKAYHRATPA